MASPILLDTSALYALASSSDKFHHAARSAYQELVDSGAPFYVTSYVLVETFALVHARLGLTPLKALVDSLRAIAEVFWVDHNTHDEAWQRMVNISGRRFSFVDWVSVVAAERLGTSLFTFDQEFRAVGLLVVPA